MNLEPKKNVSCAVAISSMGEHSKGVVIARRIMSFEPKKNLYCAVAISSIGEWDLTGTDCHVAEENSLND